MQRYRYRCSLGLLIFWLSMMVGMEALSGNHGDEHRTRGPFAPKGTSPKYARDLPYLIQHLRLELKVLPQKRTIEGQVLLTMTAQARPLDHVVLDAAELQIKEVWVNQTKARWEGIGHKLHVETGKPMLPKQPFVVRVVYSATPRTGLYFVLPDKHYPKRPVMVFSQGESEENRFWFPSYDYPNMRFTSETVFTVPKPLMVVTNGSLISQKEVGDFVTYHHKMKHNHVNYLLAVAIGVFKVYQQNWNGITIRSLVPPEDFEKAHRSFENTADMMKFFSEKIGYVYPYGKYDQVTVHNFVAGGMENVTVTILTHQTLRDARAQLDERSDGLVAHELAHQWFGDILTCKDWSHIWLNESFATYFDKLYVEHKWGRDEFDHERRQMVGWYWGSSYQRAIVTNRYASPGDVFDSHAYPKGAAVLHMIRTRLGDTLWWEAIRYYVNKHAHSLVETIDFQRALETVSGLNWQPFFDQWVYRPGHPTVDFSWTYDREHKMVVVTLRQKQPHLYVFDTAIHVTHEILKRQIVTVHVNKKVQTITIPSNQRPKMVEFDPSGHILKRTDVKKSWQEWVFQLQHGSSVLSRSSAAQQLANIPNQPEVHQALVSVLMDDKLHFSLRSQVATSLGKLARTHDCMALMKAIAIKESKVRQVVTAQLGQCSQVQPVPVLIQRMRQDQSYYVRASAVDAIARLRQPNAFDLMVEAFAQTGNQGQVRIAALSGMMELEDVRVLPYLKQSMQRGQERRVRLFALPSYAKMVHFFRKKKQQEEMFKLLAFLRDDDPFVRSSAVSALGILGDERAISHLQRHANQDPHRGTAKHVKQAIRMIHAQETLQERLRNMGHNLESIRKEQRKLLEKFEKMERMKPKRK